MMIRVEKIKRTIHFYELSFALNDEYKLEAKYTTYIQALLSKITKLVADKNALRYQRIGDKEVFINEIKFDTNKPGRRVVKGKLLSIRKDFFPMLHNTNTDEARDIEALETEGVLETSHFIIQEKTDNKTTKVNICLEYNHSGARINELKLYLEVIGKSLGVITAVTFHPLVNKGIINYKKRIGEISKIVVRVHKNNIESIRKVDKGLFENIAAVKDHFKQEYLTVELGYDIFENRKTPISETAVAAKSFVTKIIDHLIAKPMDSELFEQFLVKAEDQEKNDRINGFDLLINKIKDDVWVERRCPSRTLVSLDMFEKILLSWDRLKVKI